MNQMCKVCGEPAAGFHFGAFTCEGCKSFFGRSYNNLPSISECKNGGRCVINKKNRTSCKACRLRKCLEVGMSKSGSRYGRRSNWFKIHCLLQEQASQAEAARQSHAAATPSPPPTKRDHPCRWMLEKQPSASSSPESLRSDMSYEATDFHPFLPFIPLTQHSLVARTLAGLAANTSMLQPYLGLPKSPPTVTDEQAIDLSVKRNANITFGDEEDDDKIEEDDDDASDVVVDEQEAGCKESKALTPPATPLDLSRSVEAS